MRTKRLYSMAILFTLISVLLYSYLGYLIERSSFITLGLSVLFLFIGYAFFLKNEGSFKHSTLFGIGLIFRLIFLFSLPLLSDDFYRFIWDGSLLILSDSPYLSLPVNYEGSLENQEFLLEKMNSPEYYSVYPPFLQYLFAFSTFFLPKSILSAVVLMRLLIILAEVGTYFLLRAILSELKMEKGRVFLYFLNPLIIIELTGNLHFEAVMIFFSVLTFFAIIKWRAKGFVLSSIAIAIAFLTKMIPLLILPILWKRLSAGKAILLTILFTVFILLLSQPLINFETIGNIANSLDLYFQSFEFNASIFYILRYLGFLWKGYNVIQTAGPLLAIISGLGFFYLLLIRSNTDWKSSFQNLLFALSLYYFLASIVHPWYISFLLLFALFTNYLYPIAWSLLVFLSYAAYTPEEVEESMLIILIEYLPIYVLIFIELKHKAISFFFKENLSLQK